MARQDRFPPPWQDSMSDGCSWVADWLPFVGWMRDCCREHDRAYHYGGGTKDFHAANARFRECIANNNRCWLCRRVAKIVAWIRYRAVEDFGEQAFNWLGRGLPK